MRKEDVSSSLLEIYNREIGGLDLFKIKPWEIEVGQRITLRPLDELKQVETGLFGPCISKFVYDNIKNEVFTVTEKMATLVNVHRKIILNHHGVDLSLFMFEYTDKEPRKPKPESDVVYSITQQKKYNEIMEEMKSKVDKKRLQRMLSISASSHDHKNFVAADVVEQYLDLWAYQKYEYYILFGNKLSIEIPIEQPMTKKQMREILIDLKMKYPKYAPWINMFETEDYVLNSVGYVSSNVSSYVDYCKTGMKLSGFFSKLFKDEQFDLDLSKVLQNKLVKGFITISIDPYDYLTSSINKHDWRSCHRITDGEWGTGSLSYLLDDATLIAYKHSGKEYDYDFFGFKFSGNSKTFRQCIYFDKASCNMIFGRTYPSNSNDDIVCQTVKTLLFNQVEQHFNLEKDQEWLVMRDDMEGEYEDVCELHYSDVENDYPYTFARLLNSKRQVADFKVGYNVPCLICGDDVHSSGPNGLCCDCDHYEG